MKRYALPATMTIFLVSLALLVSGYPASLLGTRNFVPGEMTFADDFGPANTNVRTATIGAPRFYPTPDDTLVAKIYSHDTAQDLPDPIDLSAHIDYSLPQKSYVEVSVFNVTGQWVAELTRGEQPAGKHGVVWNGTDSSGRPVASGVYLLRLRTDGFVMTQGVAVVK